MFLHERGLEPPKRRAPLAFRSVVGKATTDEHTANEGASSFDQISMGALGGHVATVNQSEVCVAICEVWIGDKRCQ